MVGSQQGASPSEPHDRANLATVVGHAVDALPDRHAAMLAERISLYSAPTFAHDLLTQPPTPTFRAQAALVLDAWQKTPDVPGLSVGLMISAAITANHRARERQRIELVWTGPSSPSVPIRRATQVLQDLFASAQDQVILTTFSSGRVRFLADAISEAANRGVRTLCLLESRTSSDGGLSRDAVDWYLDLPNTTVYEWPTESRPLNGMGRPVAMHAKLAVADERLAYISSTNFTAAALDNNMECGITVTGGRIPPSLAEHFRAMINTRVVTPVRRND